MRYTESKPDALRRRAARELAHGTVDWAAELRRHAGRAGVLPARLPNLLLNGTSGIAVGMATDIPPHNLREVAAACIHLLDEPDATTRALLKHVKGPDLPTGAEIISPRRDLMEFYEKGAGSFQGARDLRNRRTATIVINALPVPGLRQPGRRSRSPSRCARRSCRWSRTSATSRTTRTRPVSSSSRARTASTWWKLMSASVRHHRPRAQLSRQPQHHRPRRPAARDGPEGHLLTDWLEFRRPHGARAACSTGSTKVARRLHILDRHADRLPQPR